MFRGYSAADVKMVDEGRAYVWHPSRGFWTVGLRTWDPLLKTVVERMAW